VAGQGRHLLLEGEWGRGLKKDPGSTERDQKKVPRAHGPRVSQKKEISNKQDREWTTRGLSEDEVELHLQS